MDPLRGTTRLAVGVVAASVIVACTGSNPSQPVAAGTPQLSPLIASPDIVVTSPPEESHAPTEDSACDDAHGDGAAFELSGVQVRRRSGAMVSVEWTIGGEVPRRGDARYVLEAANLDGSERVQYAVTYRNGAQTGHYVRDLRTRRQTMLEGEVDLYDSQLMGSFPAPPGLERMFRYSVSTVLDGKVVDRCPDGTGTVVHDR